ncbi:MAG: D-2-hydroxyacid dehydrogenase [Lachnospiraceae bacterium]|nr:D-2-hydroxyacid dehydrogenase [Lachnospiraceae bacterium]
MKRNILVVMPADEGHKELLKSKAGEAEFVFTTPEEATSEMIENAHIIVGNVAPSLLSGCKNLELVQLCSAGTDGYTADGVIPKGAVLCNATGAYGLAISEHMLACVLALKKKLNLYINNMSSPVWRDEGPVGGIIGSTVLIIGLGNIGTEFATRMKALGAKTIGVVRTKREAPECVDELHTMEELPELIGRADVITSSLPGTKATYKIYNKDFFAKMKSSAIFINVGRGTAVDTDALIDALNQEVIAGAALDVTDPEPLPEDHPLWGAKNLILTPHVSGGYHMKQTWDTIIEIAAHNIDVTVHGGELHSVIDMQTGYRKRS